MKKLMMLVMMVLGAGVTYGQVNLGEVDGEVVDPTKQPVYDAHVYIDDVFGQRYQARTDYDGRFRISAIPPGEYMMNIKQSGDTMKNIPIRISADKIYKAGVIVFEGGNFKIFGDVVVTAGGLKLIDGDLPIKELTAEEIQQSSVKFSVTDLVESMSSEIQKTADGKLVIRGSRPGDLLYLIDGVKTSEIGAMPSAAIGRMQVYTGGVPAKYGDTLGGVVIMETQSYFDLYRAWKAQQLKAGK